MNGELARRGLIVATLLVSLLARSEAIAAPGPRPPLWAAPYAGPNGGIAEAVAPSPDGTRVFVTGVAYDDTGDDYGTAAYDSATGTQL
jgi:hypothetical protein